MMWQVWVPLSIGLVLAMLAMMGVPLWPIYWTTKSIPELRHVALEERRRIWERCRSLDFRHPQTWAALIAFGLCIAGFPTLTGLVIWPGVRGSGLVGVIPAAIIGPLILGQARVSTARPKIRAELPSHQDGAGAKGP